MSIETHLIAIYVRFDNRFRKALGIIYVGYNLSKANRVDKGRIYKILAYLR